MVAFQIGKSYKMFSACDQDCIWVYTVTARTAKSITLTDEDGNTKRCRVYEFMGAESCKPLGSYSMAPTLSANRVA